MNFPSNFKEKVFSVFEISSILKEVLSSELFQNIKIQGEITSKVTKMGNTYLTLTEIGDAKIKATIKVNVFSYYDQKISKPYNIGDKVIIKGDISYYPGNGQLSFIGKEIYPLGLGDELIRIQLLKEKLEKEGLFKQERKRKLPSSITKIGIVTSSKGAAYQDILNTLKRKVPTSTVLFDCLVQGKEAPKSIINALDKAYKSDCDVIILARGGGSKEDLSCFNDEALIKKLANSPKVTITGIGHEIDTSICDLVSDIYAITPTQAANLVLKDEVDIKNELNKNNLDLDKAFERILSNKKLIIMDLASKLNKLSYETKLEQTKAKLDNLNLKLDTSYLDFLNKMSLEISKTNQLFKEKIDLRISLYQDKITSLNHQLDLLNPLISLKDGYAIIKKDNIQINSSFQLKLDDKIEIGFKDGIKKAKIID